MRLLLHRILEWATRDRVARFCDPVLGELVINETWWECTVVSKRGPITLGVGGRYEPDEQLIETARRTCQHIDEFVDSVAAYLRHESEQPIWRRFAAEVRVQAIKDVYYWWPRKPAAGMIFFTGPDQCRLWHCDIDDGRLCGLAFDS